MDRKSDTIHEKEKIPPLQTIQEEPTSAPLSHDALLESHLPKATVNAFVRLNQDTLVMDIQNLEITTTIDIPTTVKKITTKGNHQMVRIIAEEHQELLDTVIF